MENGSLKYDKIKANKTLDRLSDLFIYCNGGATMGELVFIKDGVSTTIHDNGEVTVLKVILCDECEKWVSPLGGWPVRDHTGEVVMWLCAECRS